MRLQRFQPQRAQDGGIGKNGLTNNKRIIHGADIIGAGIIGTDI